jgi:hypothetical protein
MLIPRIVVKHEWPMMQCRQDIRRTVAWFNAGESRKRVDDTVDRGLDEITAVYERATE